jgi:glycosyltransferase involved in cell wall biosynthesis
MQVSVVICTHTPERYDTLTDATESVLAGTYDDVEVVLVSDGSAEVAERMERDYGNHPKVTVRALAANQGLLVARNEGAAVASGDLVAFLDDDAVAAPDWLAKLVAAQRAQNRRAVGGRMVPRWIAGEPAFLPEEYGFLIGITHRGFGPDGDREAEGEVRNGMGSNIAFTTGTFAALNGFEPTVGGRQGDKQLQGGETELCARLRRTFDEGVWYVPDAIVEHKIYEYRTRPRWLFRRAFMQGYSKRGMERFVPEATGEEDEFLRQLLFVSTPRRLRALIATPDAAGVKQLVALYLLTLTVGLGYLYGIVAWR